MAQIRHETSMLGGRYRLLERIATGGMGSVWRAEDVVLARTVAVKMLSPALGHDPRFVERFRREARAAAGLSHPNVAGVYDYGEDGDTPFIVMELLPGETLASRIEREGRLAPAEAARIGGKVAAALQAAHDAGVVHRDVKPGNVMLTPDGGVKVMDFGIAATARGAPLTLAGTTMGTAAYLSPEQAAGERATPASDVYALGCVLYEMLTGRVPFAGDTPVAVATAHIQGEAQPVRRAAPDVPSGLAEAVDRAMAKEPTERPSSAGAFAALLIPYASARPDGDHAGGSAATTQVLPASAPTSRFETAPSPTRTMAPAPVPSRAEPRRRRAVAWALAAMLLAVALVVALIAALGGLGSTPRPGSGSSPNTTKAPSSAVVPSVTGLGLRDALRKLTGAGLTPHPVPVRGDLGIVQGTDPKEGTSLRPGDSVTVFVGDGHGADEGNGKGKGKGDGNGGHDGGGGGKGGGGD